MARFSSASRSAIGGALIVLALCPITNWRTGSRFSTQYGRLVRRAGEESLLFCQVGHFIEFCRPQRERAARVLGLVRVRIARGGYRFSVGFPASLRERYLSRTVRAGYVVTDVREVGGMKARCATRGVVAVWVPNLGASKDYANVTRMALESDLPR